MPSGSPKASMRAVITNSTSAPKLAEMGLFFPVHWMGKRRRARSAAQVMLGVARGVSEISWKIQLTREEVGVKIRRVVDPSEPAEGASLVSGGVAAAVQKQI